MDERAKELIAELMEISRSSPQEEPHEKPTRFPCKRCGGTGWIFYRMEGVDKACRCPECREVRDMHLYLRSSGIKPENYEAFTMERFKTDNIMAYEMKKLAQGFLRDPNAKGLGFFGRPGTGKTHICIATCQAMKREHHYWQYRREIQRIKAVMYKNLDRYDEMIARVSQLPWLYIDDLFKGAIKGNEMQSQDQQIMFDIINSRYVNRMPTIVSSEFPLDEITRADEGIGSRLKEMLEPYVYTVRGENRRLRGA